MLYWNNSAAFFTTSIAFFSPRNSNTIHLDTLLLLHNHGWPANSAHLRPEIMFVRFAIVIVYMEGYEAICYRINFFFAGYFPLKSAHGRYQGSNARPARQKYLSGE